MRFSKMFLPTLRESPADADVVSQRLMMRSGMMRKVAAGIYTLLPLGTRVLARVEAIVREEMDRSGAQEISMPVVIPAELWKQSRRWDEYGSELLRLNDRHGREFCLGPTHEEVVTALVRGDVRSYRDLPINLYQIRTKFRDEIRPRFGLMRGREFTMKDAYSFHADEESAEAEYANMFETYGRIFERCGLSFVAVEAESGAMGGSFSHEFMVLADTGEDAVASCASCSYAANVERAEIRPPQRAGARRDEPSVEMKKVSTPDRKSVDEVSEYLKVSPQHLIKTVIYKTDSGVVAVLARGVDAINETKLARVLGCARLELADEETVEAATRAPVGFAGPVGLDIRMIADYGVGEMDDAVAGANEADAHLTGVVPGRDFKAEYADLRDARDGDGCPRCGGALAIRRGIEVGHIFKLGTKYSTAMGAHFLDAHGVERPVIMCCYGIGIGRTAAAAVEQNHDGAGIKWPAPIAPFDCEVIALKVSDEATMRAAGEIYDGLRAAGLDALFDERDERAGVKFKDADLIGIPVRIVVGPRGVSEGRVEVKDRRTGEVTSATTDEAVSCAMRLLGR